MKIALIPFCLVLLLSSCGANTGHEKEIEEIEKNDPTDGEDGSDDSDSNNELISTEGLQLGKIQLPEGFKIDVFARVKNARSLALSPNGTLFVGNRGEDNVYAVRDTDGDMKADEIFQIASDMTMPNGVAFKDGDLYVAEVSKLWRFEDIESNLTSPQKTLIYDDYPTDRHHGWKYIAFGPDGKLYVPVGAPCNICESKDERYASITRMDPDGSNQEVFVSGVRNTVGFTWHPDTQEMWFTDNGRDWIGETQAETDDMPPCELNRATTKGQHFGYPYCHAGDILDPEFGEESEEGKNCEGYVAPAQRLGPHTAPLGVKFGVTSNFPASFEKKIFIAEHGSWNRSTKIGYRVTLITQTDGQGTSYETFASGWLDDDSQEVWGRPVDLVFAADGSMLLSDDMSGTVYRIWYDG